MLPVVTPEEMAAIDAAAPEPASVLIERAGGAVARHALALLGGAYGRRVVVVAGKGNNGNDGRAAAARLRRRGVRVDVLDVTAAPAELPRADLVIDAAYGTGLRAPYEFPRVAAGTPVLAVDIASGIDGLTGEVRGRPATATRTVTFAALKPGLLLDPGRRFSGDVHVADIGLDVERARAHVVDAADVRSWVPDRPPTTHKWRAAVWVVAGSPGMTGAAHLTAAAALRAGAGYVRLSMSGGGDDPGAPTEVVRVPLDPDLRLDPAEVGRFGAVVVGPGLGRGPGVAAAVAELVACTEAPLVVDGDGLTALADRAVDALARRTHPAVLTPHEGEFRDLAGAPPAADRIAAVRALAARLGAVVLLKGPTTIVAAPDGRVLVSCAGDARLATAGTGDVLSGVLGAFLACGTAAFEAAASAAFTHGLAASLGAARGLIASDVVALLPHALARIGEG
ncbi:MAG TPA: NAD(P)H-hydrate dehydratase [Acidimicrobiales bacterium]|nr:NAD(P)H-hydrate dehydratase [Acidimicrobiales bacterium]